MNEVIEEEELVAPSGNFAAEILRAFMRVSVKINPAELEVMANMLLDFDHPARDIDNSAEKVVVGNECKS